MIYTIIGTGNVAWFLGTRLKAAGHICKGIYGRNKATATELATLLNARPFNDLSDITDVIADVCFVAVADGSISTVASQLQLKNTLLVHTSGATPMNALFPAADRCGVLWPIYSITRHNLPVINDVPCAWETNTPASAKTLLDIATGITTNLIEAPYAQRKWMHLSSVIGNNFVNHLIAICEKICAENNIPVAAILPLIQQTFADTNAAYNKQTGPAKRGDEATINRQLHLLQQHPYWQQIYQAITASIENMYGNDNANKNSLP